MSTIHKDIVYMTISELCTFMEACAFLGAKGHGPYGKYGYRNVVERAYEYGWTGSVYPGAHKRLDILHT